MRPIWLDSTQVPWPARDSRTYATVIAGWLKRLKAWWADDETPWCSTFAAAVMQSGIQPPAAWYRGKGVAHLGQRSGHAYRRLHRGIRPTRRRTRCDFVGSPLTGDLSAWWNRGNAVTIAPFDRARVLGYRWPEGEPIQPVAALPLVIVPAHRARTKREPVRLPRAGAARGGGAVRVRLVVRIVAHGRKLIGPHRCTGTRRSNWRSGRRNESRRSTRAA